MLQGFSRGARFVDGEVFAVTAPRPAVYTAAMESFLSREINQAWTWRWMGRDVVVCRERDGPPASCDRGSRCRRSPVSADSSCSSMATRRRR